MSAPPEPFLTPLIGRLEEMVCDIPGWTPIDQLYTLYTLLLGTADLTGDIVEIGAWCGRSSVVLGHAARQIGCPTVHSIDLFPDLTDWRQNPDGTYHCQVEFNGERHLAYNQQTVWAEPFKNEMASTYRDHGSPFACFQKQVARFKLDRIVRPHRGTSASFLAGQPADFRCKFAFVDGDHGYEAVCADITRLKPHLAPGAWICFDDAFTTYDGVDAAIRRCVLGNPDFCLAQQMTRKLFVARKRW